MRLVRAFEREGRADPGGKLVGRCGAAVAEAFTALDAALAEKIGRRFTVSVAADWPNDRLEVSAS